MANVLKKGVLHKIHKFKCPPKVVSRSKLMKLEPEAWKAPGRDKDLDFQSVQGTSSFAHWYSPGASTLMVPVADQHCTTWAYKQQNWAMLKTLWVGAVMKMDHHLVFATSDRSAYKFIAMDHYKDSAVLVWPAVIQTLPRTNVRHTVPQLDISEPQLEVISDLSKLVAYHFTFRSYSSLWRQYPACRTSLKPGMLFFLCCFTHLTALGIATTSKQVQ